MIAYIAQLANVEEVWGVHLVATEVTNVSVWMEAFKKLCPKLRVLPYWGNQADLSVMRSFWQERHLYTKYSLFHVVLTSYEFLHKDLTHFQRLHWQTVIMDRPLGLMGCIDKMDQWTRLLMLRCRQRVMITPTLEDKGHVVDVRLLLHFILPSLFASQSKVTGWAVAGFESEQLEKLTKIVKAFSVGLDSNEKRVRSLLEGMVKECKAEMLIHMPPKMSPEVRRESKVSPVPSVESYTVMGYTGPTEQHSEEPETMEAPLKPELSVEVTPSDQPKKTEVKPKSAVKTSVKKAPKSRKRVTRCGKCTGCLAADCMKCGHCRDMKKYGGPGLRKQSCKNRKCLNPQVVILNTSKEERHAGSAGASHKMSASAEHLEKISDGTGTQSFCRTFTQ